MEFLLPLLVPPSIMVFALMLELIEVHVIGARQPQPDTSAARRGEAVSVEQAHTVTQTSANRLRQDYLRPGPVRVSLPEQQDPGHQGHVSTPGTFRPRFERPSDLSG
jgi:hypothetical protein